MTDVVGVYLNPPDKAVVLCVDEKSQIQALDRTQPSLPLKKGRAGTMTHDYLHFIPTSSSWLNMVERWFRELTEKAIRRGVFKSVPGPDRCDRGIPPSQQQRSQAVRMDRHGGEDPRESQAGPGRTHINPGE